MASNKSFPNDTPFVISSRIQASLIYVKQLQGTPPARLDQWAYDLGASHVLEKSSSLWTKVSSSL